MNIIKNIQLPSKHTKPILVDVYFMEDTLFKPVIIFTHGYKSFKDWGPFNLIAKHFAHKGFIFIKYNLSHNGTTADQPDEIVDKEAFGHNTVEIELDDLEAVIQWVGYNEVLKKQDYDPDQIYLLGHSRGGSNSIIKAAENPKVKKLAVWGAFCDYERIWQENYDIELWEKQGYLMRENRLNGEQLPLYFDLYQNYQHHKEAFSIEKAIKSLEIPVMISHGIEDQMVSFRHALQLKKWNKKIEMNLIPNASHVFGGYHPYDMPSLPFDTSLIVKDTVDFFNS